MDSIHLPNAIALPNAFGAPGAALSPGQVVQALVLELIESDVFRLQLPQAVLDVRSDTPLKPGNTITLAVKSGSANARLVIYSDALSAAPKGQGAAPSLAGRQPIGEAVVIARAPAPSPAPAQDRIAAEPAVLRDAPAVSPAAQPRPAPPVVAATPEQAVSAAVRLAASRQSGLAPLFADIRQVASALPAPLRAAAETILALRVPLDPQLTAADVKQAFVRSGVLLESSLAHESSADAARTVSMPDRLQAGFQPAAIDDLKAALLVVRQVLKAWAGSEPAAIRPVSVANSATVTPPDATARTPIRATDAAISRLANALAGAPEERMLASVPLSAEQATTLARSVATALAQRETPTQPQASPGGPPPPYRGAPLAAQGPATPSIAPDAAPREIADRLIAETDGALARTTLLQVASLPEQPGSPRADAAQRWTFEIPFATPQGTAVAQFEIARDARAPQPDPPARTWRARFSLDVEPMGPVHAAIALTGARTSVTLWAERASTARRLDESSTLLNDALRAAELEPAEFQLRVGAPPAARPAAPGRFMDRAT